MSDKFNIFWNELVGRYRRREGLAASPEELEKEVAKIDAVPLSEDEVQSIVSTVSSGDVRPTDVTPDLSWIEQIDTSSVEEGVLQLNRKKGKPDVDIEKRLEALRKKALDENTDDEDDLETD